MLACGLFASSSASCSGAGAADHTAEVVEAEPTHPVTTATAPIPRSSARVVPRRPKHAQAIHEMAGIAIGDPIDEAIEKVNNQNGDVRSNSIDQERDEWVRSGYRPEDEVPFLLGFDRAVSLNNPKLPVYMLFSKDGKVVLIRLSIYVSTPEEQKKIRVVEGCGLGSTAVCTDLAFMDQPVVQNQPSMGRKILHWLNHGVSMTVQSDQVIVVDVYGDLDDPTIDRLSARLASTPTPPGY